MSAIPMLDEEECSPRPCSACGRRPRASSGRNTWCTECKSAWQRDYRAGRRRFVPAPDPIRVGCCLIWQGAVNPETGYGQQALDGHSGYPHRWAWESVHGEIPPDMTIDHFCNERLCVETGHMQVVTRSENTKLAWARRRGEEVPDVCYSNAG